MIGTFTSNPTGVYDYGAGIGYKNASGRTSVAKTTAAGDLIFIAAGQSIITNNCQTAYTPTNPTKVLNFNIYDGNLYQLTDPVLGATGAVGSYIGRLGDKLIAAGKATRVIFFPIGVGSTASSYWLPSGMFNHRLRVALWYARSLGFPVSAILWDQGQGNFGQTSAAYQANIIALQNDAIAFGYDVPWFIAKDTLVNYTSVDPVIQAAQDVLVNHSAKRWAGPNIDLLTGATNRYDGVHLSTTGSDSAAADWVTALGQVF